MSLVTEQHERGGGSGGGYPGVGVRPTWEPWLVALLAVVAVAFGYLVEHRSVYSERRRTDAGVFFRAGYAVREGISPYRVPDENEWYFLYPPAVAAAFVPLADPPTAATPGWTAPAGVASGERAKGYLPYAVSVAVWYALGIGCTMLCVELLARALIRGAADPRVRGLTPRLGGWWNIRLWPLLLTLPDILSTLSRGQINLLVLACVCSGVYALARGWKVWGGAAMCAAACIKVIPGLLLFDVLSRRGVRAFVGYGLCGLAMMVAIPVVVFGPTRAYEHTHEWVDRVLLAGVKGNEDRLQAGAGFQDTDNLSIQGSLHNVVNMGTRRGSRPAAPEPWVKGAHVVVSLGLLGATLLVGRSPWARKGEARREDSALEITLRVGMLGCVLLLASPMCHRHYYVFLMPALAGLSFMNLMRSPLAVPNGRGLWLMAAYAMMLTLPRWYDSEHPAWWQSALRDLPLPLAANVAVWGLCARALIELSRRDAVGVEVVR